MKYFIKIVLYLWQLLQNALGFIFTLNAKQKEVDNIKYCQRKGFPGGITLGEYILLGSMDDRVSVHHEYGHTKQSRLLGPLYLIVIGLPSILWAWYWTSGRKYDYYDFYTEKWADKLGGVVKDKYGRRRVL